MTEKCKKCGTPLVKPEDRCGCEENTCRNCCSCEEGCECGCKTKK